MKRIVVLACAMLAFGLSSPIAAQDMARAVPEAQQLPPPPPFPPMPSSRPTHRYVDLGSHHSRARSKATSVRHASSVKRDRKAHPSSKTSASRKDRTSHKASANRKKSHKAIASRRSAHKEKAMHFSARTIRSCHAMTYRQIMRSSSCRSMIKQDLAATPAKARTSHKASVHRKSSAHSKRARSRSTSKKRRR